MKILKKLRQLLNEKGAANIADASIALAAATLVTVAVSVSSQAAYDEFIISQQVLNAKSFAEGTASYIQQKNIQVPVGSNVSVSLETLQQAGIISEAIDPYSGTNQYDNINTRVIVSNERTSPESDTYVLKFFPDLTAEDGYVYILESTKADRVNATNIDDSRVLIPSKDGDGWTFAP